MKVASNFHGRGERGWEIKTQGYVENTMQEKKYNAISAADKALLDAPRQARGDARRRVCPLQQQLRR